MKTILLISAIGLVGCGGYYGPTDYQGSAGAGGNDSRIEDGWKEVVWVPTVTWSGTGKTFECYADQAKGNCGTGSYALVCPPENPTDCENAAGEWICEEPTFDIDPSCHGSTSFGVFCCDSTVSGGLNSPCDIHLDCAAPMSCQEKTTANGVVKTCQCAYCQSDSDCPSSSYYCIRGGCYHACNSDADCNSANTCQVDTIVNGPKLGQVTVCE